MAEEQNISLHHVLAESDPEPVALGYLKLQDDEVVFVGPEEKEVILNYLLLRQRPRQVA